MPCSSVSRYATFSRTVMESNSALSWKTIPILPRNSNRSFSCIWVTSSPSTVMRPESGRISPRTSLRIRLFPEPATPNRALVSPRARQKETPRSTLFSAKESTTSSNTMAIAAGSFVFAAAESRGKVGVDINLVVGEHGHQESSYEKVEDQNQHGGSHHGLRGGTAHALGSAARVHSVEASDGRADDAEQHWLDQAHEYILEHKRLPGALPVLTGIQTKKNLGNHQAAGQAD